MQDPEREEILEQVVEQAVAESEPAQDEGQSDIDHVEQYESKVQVPLSALQKERKKRQELEYELQFERRQREMLARPPAEQEEDNSKYESATKAEVSQSVTQSQAETMRMIEEKLWIKQNPEKYERINQYLPEFLKQRPNLATAINTASNRYEEAFTLMDALTPKQKQALKVAPKKEAPGAPTGVPKAQAMNEAVDVMTMSDAEFSQWRSRQKQRARAG